MDNTQGLAEAVLDPLETSTDRLFRISLDVYHGVLEHGLLTEHDKVVLLDGLLVRKMTRGPRHSTSTGRVAKALERLPLGDWHVRKEEPILVPGGPGLRDSEPEPDVAVVLGSDDRYSARHPGPADVTLVVEVADSSLCDDRVGLLLYAWADIPVAWLVNLKDRVVEVHTRPTGPAAEPARYQDLMVFGADDDLPVVIDGREVGQVAVRDLLP